MSPLDAVAAAIRERLQAGQPAPLLGLGTLVRKHVAARVQERPDGTRVMLPPGETIALGPSAADEPPLAPSFARLRALPATEAAAAYQDAIDQIEALLSATGEVRLPGVGLLRRTSSGVVLGVEAELLAAVNRRYEGLAPVPTELPPAQAPSAGDAFAEAPADAGASPEPPPAPAAEPRDQRPGLPPIETVPPSEDDAGPSGTPDNESDAPAPLAAPLVDGPPKPEYGAPGQPAESDGSAPLDTAEEPPAAEPGDPFSASLHDDLDAWVKATATEAGEDLSDSPPATATDGDDPTATSAEADGGQVADPTFPSFAPPSGTPPDAPAATPTDAPSGTDAPESGDPSAPLETEAPSAEPAPGLSAPNGEADAETPPLMAPFGAPDEPALADILPPTDPEPTDPEPAAATPREEAPMEDASPLSPDDEWERETWTAPALGGTSSFDPSLTADTDLVDAVIEDADFDIVPPTPAPTADTSDLGANPEHDAPPVLSVPPPAPDPADAPADAPPALDAPPAAAKPAAAPATPASNRRWVGWLLLGLVVVALVAAAIWFWPEIRSRVRLLTDPDETITVEAVRPDAQNAVEALPGALDGLDVAHGALVQGAVPGDVAPDGPFTDGGTLLDPTTATLPSRPARTGDRPAAKPPLAAPRSLGTDDDPPAPPTGLGESPAPGVALLPPRVSGLDRRLVAALADRGAPVDPAADAWTFVVLSTVSREEAETLRDRYHRAGYRSSVLTSRGGQFRVCVGQFGTRDDAIRVRDRLPPQAPADTWALYLKTL